MVAVTLSDTLDALTGFAVLLALALFAALRAATYCTKLCYREDHTRLCGNYTN
jgi:hypothetical protein